MKRIVAIVLIIATALCGCTQRYDARQPGSLGTPLPTITPAAAEVVPEASEIQPLIPTPTPSDDIQATPGPTMDAGATAGQRPNATPSSGAFPGEDIDKGMQDGTVKDGFDVQVGSFSLAIPRSWKAAENYDLDAAVASVDGVYRYSDGDDRLVISSIDMALTPIDLDNGLDVARTVSYNTGYEWMEYVSHEVVETPLGKALFILVHIGEDAPDFDEAYVGISMLLPIGNQALNLGISTPARTSDQYKSEVWRLLGRLAGSATYAEGGNPI